MAKDHHGDRGGNPTDQSTTQKGQHKLTILDHKIQLKIQLTL
jgi:hypothetical protein